jgi:hypothetical protein
MRPAVHKKPQPELLAPTLPEDEFRERLLALNRQTFSSPEFEFDAVTTHVFRPPAPYAQVDRSFFLDGENWHFFYNAFDVSLKETYLENVAAGDWDAAARNSIEHGMGHAVGSTLSRLEYKGLIEPPVEERHDMLLRSNGWVFRHEGRFGMLYGVRGAGIVSKGSVAFGAALKTTRSCMKDSIYPAFAGKAINRFLKSHE